jgi:hypothetical protein
MKKITAAQMQTTAQSTTSIAPNARGASVESPFNTQILSQNTTQVPARQRAQNLRFSINSNLPIAAQASKLEQSGERSTAARKMQSHPKLTFVKRKVNLRL